MIANIFFGDREVERDIKKDIKNPYTRDIVSQYSICHKNDSLKALEIAKNSFQNNKTILLSQRVLWIEDVVKKLLENRERFAKIITDEVAKPIKFSRVEVDRCIETLKLTISSAIEQHGETFSSDAMPSGKKTVSFFKRVPVGVAVLITPFNFPLNLIAHKLAPALISGNSIVLKPTPEAPRIAYEFAKLFIESQYRSPDSLSLIYGDAEVGSALVTSNIPRVISFTGSVEVGRIIISQAGIKKVSLELGGNSATFIDEDSDIEFASKRSIFGAFFNSGQVCISLQRVYIHKNIYDQFVINIKKEVKKIIIGNPYNEDTFMSSLIDQNSIERSIQWVDNAVKNGANIIIGGKKEDSMFLPTVLENVKDNMEVICQEVFAPILTLIKVNNFDEALSKINNSQYGLQHSIFTNSLKNTIKAIDEFESGGVIINDIPTLRFDIQPYGGVKNSGIGREGAKYALEEFTDIKSIVINS